MLKHFKAINVQEPKDRGAPPAGALSILGPAVQQRAWVLVFASTQPQASLDCRLCCLRSSMGQGPRAHLGGQRPVDLPDQPGKSAAVHGLGKSISCIRSLFQVQRAQELPAKVRREMNATDPFPSASRMGSGRAPENHDHSVLPAPGEPGGWGTPGEATVATSEGRRCKDRRLRSWRWESQKRPWSTCTPFTPHVLRQRLGLTSSPLAMIFLCVRASRNVEPSTPSSCQGRGWAWWGCTPPHPSPSALALCSPPLTLVRYLSWFSVVTWALLSSSAAKWMLPKCRTLATILSRSWTNREVWVGVTGGAESQGGQPVSSQMEQGIGGGVSERREL